MTLHLARLLATILVAGALLGCGSDDEPPVDEGSTSDVTDDDPAGSADAVDDASDEGSGDGAAAGPDDDQDDGPEGADEDEAGARHLVGSVEIDEERVSDNNVYVTVTGLTAEPNAVYVDIVAFNGSEYSAFLAWGAQNVHLLADDTRLTFRPPEDNDVLEVPSGGELEGRLAFLGRIPASTESMTLRLNWGDDGPLNVTTDIPSFEFADLPVPSDP